MLLQFGDVCGQRGFVGPTHQVVADHFRRSLRRLAAGREADQQTGDDGAVRLNLDAVLVVAEQVPTAQQVLERAEENLDRPAIVIQQGDEGTDRRGAPATGTGDPDSIRLVPSSTFAITLPA